MKLLVTVATQTPGSVQTRVVEIDDAELEGLGVVEIEKLIDARARAVKDSMVMWRWNLLPEGGAPSSADVYNRPECVFHYCPMAAVCRGSDACQSPAKPKGEAR